MQYADKFVLNFDEVLVALGSADEPFPASTLHALNKEGKGPKWFKVGRRCYTLKADFEAWLVTLSQGEQS
jgi:hypothetical protein